VVDPDGRWYKTVLSATGATQVTAAANRGYMAEPPVPVPPPSATTLLTPAVVAVWAGVCIALVLTAAAAGGIVAGVVVAGILVLISTVGMQAILNALQGL